MSCGAGIFSVMSMGMGLIKSSSGINLQNNDNDNKLISERFRQFCFFTKRSTLLLEKSRKIIFLHLFFIPFLLMLVD